jgi:hypothetical protein
VDGAAAPSLFAGDFSAASGATVSITSSSLASGTSSTC